MPSLKQLLFDAKNLARREQFHQAIRLYRKCLEVDPENEEALTGLGGCHYGLGDHAKSRRIWLACLNLYPNNERVKHLLEKVPSTEADDPTDLSLILDETLDDDGIAVSSRHEHIVDESRLRRAFKVSAIIFGLGCLLMLPFLIRLWISRGNVEAPKTPQVNTVPTPELKRPSPRNYDGRAVNRFGVSLEGIFDTDSNGIEPLWRTASEVCGDWGFVEIRLKNLDKAVPYILETVVRARAHRLTPIFVGPGPFPEDQGAPATTFVSNVRVYRSILVDLGKLGVEVPYLEVPGNLDRTRPQAEYSAWLEALVLEIQEVSPKTKIIAGGLYYDYPDFLRSVVRNKQTLGNLVGLWAIHSRPAVRILGDAVFSKETEHAPEFSTMLRSSSLKPPRFFLTTFVDETNPKDFSYVPRGDALAKAWDRVYLYDETFLAGAPFTISSPLGYDWPATEWFDPSGKATRTYRTIVDTPKPEGQDYLFRGGYTLEGRVFDDVLNRGIPDAYVAAFPGPYVAVTDSEGKFKIASLYSNSYQIRAQKDGYRSAGKMTVDPTKRGATWEVPMSRSGYINGSFDRIAGDNGTAEDWSAAPAEENVVLSVDQNEKRSGSAGQRIEIRPGEGQARLSRLGKPLSATAGIAYKGEIWVKCTDVLIGNGRGLVFRLDFTDAFGETVATVETIDKSEASADWHPCILAGTCPPGASRIRIGIETDVSRGIYLLDDAFLHDADLPLPSETAHGLPAPGPFRIYGKVTDAEGNSVDKACVVVWPSGKTSVGDSNGNYSVAELSAGDYSLLATCPLCGVYRIENLKVGEGNPENIDIVLRSATTLKDLQNPGFEDVDPNPEIVKSWNRFGFIDGLSELSKTNPPVRPHRERRMLILEDESVPRYGGVFQSVSAEPGAKYEASFWLNIAAPDKEREWAKGRIGIDPVGGTNHQSGAVVWSERQNVPGEWKRVNVVAAAKKERITVFIELYQTSIATQVFADTVQVRKIPVFGE